MNALRIAYPIVLALLLLTRLPVQLAAKCPVVIAHWQPLTAALHLVSFLVLGWLMLTLGGRLPNWLVLVGLVICAGGSELAQSLVPRRVADPADFLMNLAGIALAAALVWLLPQSVRRPVVAGRIGPGEPTSRRRAA